MSDRKLLERLIVALRLWEEEQDVDVLLPEIVDEIEEYIFQEEEPKPSLDTSVKKAKPQFRTTQLSTLRQWWVEHDGERKVEDWLEKQPVTYLKRFCKQEKLDFEGQKTRTALCIVIRNAVQGPIKISSELIWRKRKRT